MEIKKTNARVIKTVYDLIINHTKVVQSPFGNNCLKVYIYGNSEKQMVPKLFFQMSFQDIHNRLAIPTEKGVMKEARDEENNIIISGSILRNILPHQLDKVSSRYRVMCGCGC